MIELNKIKRSMHADVIASFWSMLQHLDNECVDNKKDVILRRQVEGYYAQWNRMTGDSKIPRFKQIEEAQKKETVTI